MWVIFGGWLALLIAGAIASLTLVRHRSIFLALIVVAAVGLLVFGRDQSAAIRLLTSSLFSLYIVKLAILLRRDVPYVNRMPPTATLLFFTIWPGMAVDSLMKRQPPTSADVSRFVRGVMFFVAGLAVLVITALGFDRLGPLLSGWLTIAGLLLVVHFGTSEILTCVMRLCGWPVAPLFDRPEASRSVREFWGKRWNGPFIEMDRILFARPLIRRFGAARTTALIFAISGLLHEMAISYPAGRGWGLPMLYFAIQAVAVEAERRTHQSSKPWTWIVVLGPLPLLFHPAFVLALPTELCRLIHQTLLSIDASALMSWALWLLGAAQLSVLFASGQVPKTLGWREELPRLRPFNQKLMWTYGGFVVLTIVGFAVMTLVLHEELLRGDRAAVAFAIFAFVYWVVRLLVDAFYFDTRDWPNGPLFEVGHVMLNSLFVLIATGYGGAAVWGLTHLRR